MKPTKQKHGKENIIGKIIYGFLMFIPLLAIGVTCAYAIFNKNAYQSYSDNSIKQSTLVTSENNQIVGQTYLLNFKENTTTGTSNYVYFSSSTIDFTKFEGVNFNVSGYRLYGNGRYIYLMDENNVQHNITTTSNEIKEIMNGQTLVFESGNMYQQTFWFDYYLITYQSGKLDNVFYYSIDKVEESPLFNWSSNTATYSVLQTTCTTLGITTQFIPMLLSYWLMMSLMYLLYDIALLIVHMAHNRIHDIESSM